MFSVRFSPNTIGRCCGGSSPHAAAPDGENLAGGLGVHADVPLRDRRRIAAVFECAAHDHQPSQQSRQRGFLPQRQGQVGQWAGRHADQLAGMGVRGPDPCLRGVVGGELAIRRRQGGIAQTLRSVGVLGRAKRRAHRLFGTLRHRNALDPAQLQQAQVVLANLLHRNISRGGGDADQFGVGAGEQVRQRHRVVHARVDVSEDGLRHGRNHTAADELPVHAGHQPNRAFDRARHPQFGHRPRRASRAAATVRARLGLLDAAGRRRVRIAEVELVQHPA